MQMPKPTADHQRLTRLAGSWKGTEKLYPSPWDPAGGEAQGSSRGRVALGGFALIVDYQQSRGGKPVFEGHGVYTFDSHAGEVVLHWFDCMGHGVEQFRGRWSGNALTVQSRNATGHARLSYDCSRDDVMTSCMEMSPDGVHWSKLFDGRYERAD